MDRRVTIVEPKAGWPTEFEAIAMAIREALGSLALRIDHIGSTAVPGLPAKDIIDVQVTVAALDREDLAPALARSGFAETGIGADHRPPGANGPDEEWRKLLFKPKSGRPANVHVRVAGTPNQRYPLLFRDYLRAHPDAATAYARLKRGLADLGIDPGAYSDLKDPACDLILIAAEDWAERTGWTA
jgi:GrpB-like predicted nucleotidyltransferase (UPF0157 family)